MKQIVRIINFDNKVIEKVVKVRNIDHFQAQLTNKAKVFKDKTKYTRKEKHKNNLEVY